MIQLVYAGVIMIDTLFGSKTRVKLLHLFLNNPGRSFYVREITRIVDEQINSVRRELSNMINIGIITSDSADNKLYYSANTKYQFYRQLSEIFRDDGNASTELQSIDSQAESSIYDAFSRIHGAKVVIVSGLLVKGSNANIDLIVAGPVSHEKTRKLISEVEKTEHMDIRYSIMSYDDFYYRLSVRDRFIIDVLNDKRVIIVDTEGIIV